MATSSETIWAALLTRLQGGVSSAKTITRQVHAGKEWAFEQLPAVELWDNGTEEPWGERDGLQYGWSVSGEIVIVAKPNSDAASSPFSDLNALVAEVKTALERDAGDLDTPGSAFYGQGRAETYTNLGGRIASMRLGTVEKGGGANSQVVAKIPITMNF